MALTAEQELEQQLRNKPQEFKQFLHTAVKEATAPFKNLPKAKNQLTALAKEMVVFDEALEDHKAEQRNAGPKRNAEQAMSGAVNALKNVVNTLRGMGAVIPTPASAGAAQRNVASAAPQASAAPAPGPAQRALDALLNPRPQPPGTR
jgi:hypothetical protein